MGYYRAALSTVAATPMLILAASSPAETLNNPEFVPTQEVNPWVASPVGQQSSSAIAAEYVPIEGYAISDKGAVMPILTRRPDLKRFLDEARRVASTYFGLDAKLTVEHFPADEYTTFDTLMVFIENSKGSDFDEQLESFSNFEAEWLMQNFEKTAGVVSFALA